MRWSYSPSVSFTCAAKAGCAGESGRDLAQRSPGLRPFASNRGRQHPPGLVMSPKLRLSLWREEGAPMDIFPFRRICVQTLQHILQ